MVPQEVVDALAEVAVLHGENSKDDSIIVWVQGRSTHRWLL